jgi:chromosome partitioning protein
MIYTVGGIKGGSGKTTIATNLTIYLSAMGRKVLFVDADDQESATDFSAIRGQQLDGELGYTIKKITGSDLNTSVAKLVNEYDEIVIDTGGRDTVSQRSALSISHVYLVPFAPRSLDIWTLRKVEQLVAEMSKFNPELICLTFINRADTRGAYTKDTAELLQNSGNLQFLDASLGNRVSFANAISMGQGVIETTPKDGKAIAEIIDFYKSVQKVIKTKDKRKKLTT